MTTQPLFVVIQDKFQDRHAGPCTSQSRSSIIAAARALRDDLPFDEDETLAVGFVRATDAGAARLMPVSFDDNPDTGIVFAFWWHPGDDWQAME